MILVGLLLNEISPTRVSDSIRNQDEHCLGVLKSHEAGQTEGYNAETKHTNEPIFGQRPQASIEQGDESNSRDPDLVVVLTVPGTAGSIKIGTGHSCAGCRRVCTTTAVNCTR